MQFISDSFKALERTTNGHGQVNDYTLKQLKKLDAGSWFNPKFAGERVPELSEILDLAIGRALVNIEIKPHAYEAHHPIDAIEHQVVNLIHRRSITDFVLGDTHLVDARFGYSDSREDSLRAAEEVAARALSVDDTDSEAYSTLRAIHLWKGEHDKSIAMGEKALTLNPNRASHFAGLAWTMFCSGRPEEALELIRRAMRLDPNYPDWWLMILEEAYRLSGRYDEAIETIKEELRRYESYFTRTRLALYYAQTGRDEEARAEIERALRIKPDMIGIFDITDL